MSKRFSDADRLKTRQALISRDGEKCAICGKKPPAVRLEIDHVLPLIAFPDGGQKDVQDDTPHPYDAMGNLRLACVHCNRSRQYENIRRVYVGESRPAVTITPTHTHQARTTKPPPFPKGHDATNNAREEIDYTHAPAQMVANASYEPRFRDEVLKLVDEQPDGMVLYADLRDAGAEAVGCSVQTAADYLAKMVSKRGKLEKVKGGHTGSLTYVKRRQEVTGDT